MDAYVESVEAFIENTWKTLTKQECNFRYRESAFKDIAEGSPAPVIWSVKLKIPSRTLQEVLSDIESLLRKRIETQPHIKTAGSCFKALLDGTPAWKLIDAARLRGRKIGGVEISTKHANFLLNVEKGSFADAIAITELIKKSVPEIAGVEMRFYGDDGKLRA
jgi:UDP-N-acetylmuramate dehydrogenase